MPFGVVSGIGRGKGVLNGGGHRRRGKDSFGVNMEHPIATNEDFMVQFFSAVKGGDAAVPKLLWDFLFLLSTRLHVLSD